MKKDNIDLQQEFNDKSNKPRPSRKQRGRIEEPVGGYDGPEEEKSPVVGDRRASKSSIGVKASGYSLKEGDISKSYTGLKDDELRKGHRNHPIYDDLPSMAKQKK